MAWAKFPVGWMTAKASDDPDLTHTLSTVHWRDYTASAMAALVLLMLLCIRCNVENRSRYERSSGQEPWSSRVRMSYEDMRLMSGFHKQTIGKAISLLSAWGALEVEVNGRSNVYVLAGLLTPGEWRKLPVEPLFEGQRFVLRDMLRRKESLNALKLYFVLLRLFSDRFQTTSISYSSITKWTGIRRQDIRQSLAILAAYNLVRVSYDRDARHGALGDNDQAQRYWLAGLSTSGRVSATIQEAIQAFDIPAPPASASTKSP